MGKFIMVSVANYRDANFIHPLNSHQYKFVCIRWKVKRNLNEIPTALRYSSRKSNDRSLGGRVLFISMTAPLVVEFSSFQ